MEIKIRVSHGFGFVWALSAAMVCGGFACQSNGSSADSDTDADSDSDTDSDSNTDTHVDTDTESSECNEAQTFADGLDPTDFIHVATDGSDSEGDGSENQPYATIEYAAASARPGTAVRVHAGTYPGGQYIADLSGTAGAPIWIGGAPGEEKPHLQGNSNGIHFVRVSYLVVHDLHVSDATANGINCDDGGDYDNASAAHHVIFQNLLIHDIGTGNNDCLKLSGPRIRCHETTRFASRVVAVIPEFIFGGGQNGGERAAGVCAEDFVAVSPVDCSVVHVTSKHYKTFLELSDLA